MLSRIKVLLFVLKSCTEYNTDFIYHKKRQVNYVSVIDSKYVSMVSTLAFAFKVFTHIICFTVKKVSFPQTRNFFTVKKGFHNQETFLQSRNISTVIEIFHKQWGFLQSRKFSTTKIYLIKEIFYKQESFLQKLFPWSRKFFTKIFTQSKKISAKKS